MNIKAKIIISLLIMLAALSIFITEWRDVNKSLPSNSAVTMESPSLAGWAEGE